LKKSNKHGSRTYRTYQRSTFLKVRRAPISTIRISTGAMFNQLEKKTWQPYLSYLSKIDFLTSTTSPHKYDSDKYGRHDNFQYENPNQHGARTYPNRTYGYVSYLSKSDFSISTASPHKYDLDKYGRHV